MDAIKSLVVSFDPNGNTFSLSVQERELYQTINLTQSMTEVFVSIGKAAYEANVPICFFIDEIQYMQAEQLGALIAALHRTNQLGYPVMIIGAGLPKIYKMLSEEKTYSERLFWYKEIDSLSEEEARKAIKEPVKKVHLSYEAGAVDKIIQITKGYPFFLQQLCQIVYQNAEAPVITEQVVISSVAEFYETLDDGFFKVRYERCTEGDKKFIFAMVKCGDLPCTITNVARNLDKNVNSVSPTRAQLINKGIIYAVWFKELDFTVPDFCGFIERQEEYQEWCREEMVE